MASDAETIRTLQAENTRLRQRVAELERALHPPDSGGYPGSPPVPTAAAGKTDVPIASNNLALDQHVPYRQIFEHHPVPMVIFRDDGIVVALNRQNERLLQTPRDAIVGTFNMFTDEEAYIKGYTEAFEQALQGATVSMPPTLYDTVKAGHPGRSDDPMICTETTYVPLTDANGTIQYICEINKDVTAHYLAQRDLQTFYALTEHVPDAIAITSQSGELTYANPAYSKLIGISADAAHNALDHLKPDDQRAIMEGLKHQIAEHGHWRGTLTWQRADGSPVYVRGTAFPMHGHAQGQPSALGVVFQDVTEQLSIDTQLQRNQKLFESVLNGSSAIIFVKDLEGTFLLVNRNLADLMHMQPEDVIGRNQADLFPSEIVAEWNASKKQVVEQNRTIAFEESLMLEDGLHNYISFRFPIYDEQGRIYATGGIATDITEQKQKEEQLRQLTEDLQQANEQLEQMSRLKDEFLANMSHELRTPLNVILGMAQALQEGVYDPIAEQQQHPLHAIEESGNHLLMMITDILDMARMEAGKNDLDLKPIDLATVSHTSMQAIEHEAHKKQLSTSAHIDQGLPPLLADERRVRQMLLNLLSNAVKFTPEGGRVGLEVHSKPDEHAVELIVWDTGIGIAPEQIGRLFKPFVQVDSSLSRRYAGTGLGLAMVAKLADLHGGTVDVESEESQGSRFRIRLPWRTPEALPAPRAAPEATPTQTTPTTGALLLLAEDNELNILTLTDYLESKGYRVIIARSGSEVLDMARQQAPNIVLMDMQMPDLDGLQATRHLRSEHALAHIPIIAMTALAMPGDRERCLAAGASDYLSKPINFQQLIEVIEANLPHEES
jgi:PAS domain S-box-containing protein